MDSMNQFCRKNYIYVYRLVKVRQGLIVLHFYPYRSFWCWWWSSFYSPFVGDQSFWTICWLQRKSSATYTWDSWSRCEWPSIWCRTPTVVSIRLFMASCPKTSKTVWKVFWSAATRGRPTVLMSTVLIPPERPFSNPVTARTRIMAVSKWTEYYGPNFSERTHCTCI